MGRSDLWFEQRARGLQATGFSKAQAERHEKPRLNYGQPGVFVLWQG
jgi:hypothetical protein